MNVTVRKEVVCCKNCEHKVDFWYLSDFAYGERLVLYDNGKKYAYINLLKDEIYNYVSEEIENILQEKELDVTFESKKEMMDITFMITCDMIEESTVDFRGKRKCENCDCEEFGDLLVEPEKIIDVDIPEITHFSWNKLTEEERRQTIISYIDMVS